MVDQRVQDDEVEAAIAAREALRPTVWTGHLILYGTDAERSATFYEIVGMRRVAVMAPFAVMELRGGTHLVLRHAPPRRATREAPFDLMYDDVGAMRRRCQALGLRPTALKRGRIHDVFRFVGPGRHRFTVFSSHASSRSV